MRIYLIVMLSNIISQKPNSKNKSQYLEVNCYSQKLLANNSILKFKFLGSISVKFASIFRLLQCCSPRQNSLMFFFLTAALFRFAKVANIFINLAPPSHWKLWEKFTAKLINSLGIQILSNPRPPPLP